jgi:hypothetical protein
VPAASIDEHASFEFSLFSDNFAVSAPSRYAEKLFTLLAFAIHSVGGDAKPRDFGGERRIWHKRSGRTLSIGFQG